MVFLKKWFLKGVTYDQICWEIKYNEPAFKRKPNHIESTEKPGKSSYQTLIVELIGSVDDRWKKKKRDMNISNYFDMNWKREIM